MYFELRKYTGLRLMEIQAYTRSGRFGNQESVR
jgi:hypothetical protein